MGVMTHLCVPIFVTSPDQAQRDAALAAEAGADLVELRIDTYAGDIAALLQAIRLPCIVTCRAAGEGGQCNLPDEARIARLQQAIQAGAAYIDVELATLRQHPLASDRLIVSAHDFTTRPERLHNLLIEMAEVNAAVHKVVWMPRSIRDNAEVLEILTHRRAPTIALCMGEAGIMSRVLAKKFDAFLTFASLSRQSETAPGQVSIADLKNLYCWDTLNANTKVYGVVAQPVMHSMSPAIHNAAFTATGFDGVYLPLLVEGSYESFKAFMETFVPMESLHLGGLSVTIPHKANALRYLRDIGAEVEDLAARIGSVNTIIIDRTTGKPVLRGINTDYAAILDSITQTMHITRSDLRGIRVAVLGAGGTGRTAVAGLAHYGATVVVYNRTRQRADALAAEFSTPYGKVVSADFNSLCKTCCAVIINTTSVGMYPKTDVSPLDGIAGVLSEKTVVFDTVYNPMQTNLLTQASAAGAKTISGVEMFVRQAETQFEAWTKLPAPRQVMRAVVEKRLNPGA